jgi:hypothetical protein
VEVDNELKLAGWGKRKDLHKVGKENISWY